MEIVNRFFRNHWDKALAFIIGTASIVAIVYLLKKVYQWWKEQKALGEEIELDKVAFAKSKENVAIQTKKVPKIFTKVEKKTKLIDSEIADWDEQLNSEKITKAEWDVHTKALQRKRTHVLENQNKKLKELNEKYPLKASTIIENLRDSEY